jgi:uncharacterized linocin/CFP29 family protein
MNHLLRSLAPITDSGWELLDREAREHLTPALAARKLVDFAGPRGWEHSATNLGRTTAVASAPSEGVDAVQRRVLPLAELRASFTVSLSELRDHDRGAVGVGLEELDEAARRIAVAENVAVFHGWTDASIAGITDTSPHKALPLDKNADTYPRPVAGAVERLLESGISGPYGLALGRDEYTRVAETAEHGGYPLFDHLHKILGGPIVWAPGVKGAVVLSLRGGDFLFESGQDLSIGYERHDAEAVDLYLEESFSFVVATSEAAVALGPQSKRSDR